MKKKIPELRFPGFDGEWEEKKLGTITRIERGRFSPRPRNNPIYYGGKIPFVQTSDVVNSRGRISRYSQTLNEEGLKVSKKFSKGTVLITIAANIGFAGVLEIDMACPDSLVGISCSNRICNIFLNYIFEIEQSKMDYLAVEAAQKNINISFLQNYHICFPTLPEQQKIADFLTLVDEKINRLTRKKTLLEKYKKGVMQKIFSQEIRFPGFEGEWEKTTFGELFTFHPTNSFSRDKLNYSEGKVKNIHYGDIHTKFSSIFEMHRENVPYINLDVNIKKIPLESYCQEGDLVIADASEDNIDIGKSIEIKSLSEERLLAGLHTFLARPIKNCMAIGFGGYLMQSWGVRKQLMTIAQGIKVLSLSKNRLANIFINLPTLPEQQKIADFLTLIDKKIEQVDSLLEKTKQWKSGLLQKMFV